MTDLSALKGLAAKLVDQCTAAGVRVATAESCTGGLVAAAITEVSGASAIFDWGVVSYSNFAKTNLLGVSPSLLSEHGAVSEQVAVAMAEGALARSGADIAVAVTGIAGPAGGSEAKPVGLVHFSIAAKGRTSRPEVRKFAGPGREAIRRAAAEHALRMLIRAAADQSP